MNPLALTSQLSNCHPPLHDREGDLHFLATVAAYSAFLLHLHPPTRILPLRCRRSRCQSRRTFASGGGDLLQVPRMADWFPNPIQPDHPTHFNIKLTSHSQVKTYIVDFKGEYHPNAVGASLAIILLHTDETYVTQLCISRCPVLEKDQPSGNPLLPSRGVDSWSYCCTALNLHSRSALIQHHYKEILSGRKLL